MQCAREARDTADARGHAYSQVMAGWGLGYAHLASGRLAEASSAFEESLELCRTSSNVHWFSRVAASLGYARALGGGVEDGLPLLEQGTAEADRIGLRACSPLLITWLGEAYLIAGRRDDAGRAAQRALDRARQQGEQGYEAYALRLLAEIEQSETRYRAALERAEALGMRPLAGRCHLGLSGLLERKPA
jgi:tetratricopeptide (TPR) repeat protein